jgi:hypothetical protein
VVVGGLVVLLLFIVRGKQGETERDLALTQQLFYL